MKKKIILTTLLIIFIIILFSSVAFANNLLNLQNKIHEIQSQIKESNLALEGIEIELTQNLQELNNLNQKIAEYENDIETYEQGLINIAKEINTVSEKLNLTEENYTAQVEILQNRMVALYEAGDILYLDVLLRANSISEFISNYYLIDEMIKFDNDLLKNIEEQKSKIEEAKNILENRQVQLQSIKDNKEKATISLENSKIIRNSFVNKLTEDEKITQEKLNEAQTELNNLESQIVLLSTLNLGDGYINGEFIWPAPGYTTVTSKFGMRFHPVLKVNRIHTGTDIGMPTGSYIVASNDGVVTQATYNVGYGNMVVIDHGGGISTLYGHGSSILTEIGKTVKKGDIIMLAGSTGWSTGPHLHFEVRINGTAIDSLEFLNNQSMYLKANETEVEIFDETNGGKENL